MTKDCPDVGSPSSFEKGKKLAIVSQNEAFAHFRHF